RHERMGSRWALAERKPTDIDLLRLLRVEQPVVLVVEAAGRPLAGRRLQRRILVEAEALRRVQDRRGSDVLADLAEDRVDRVFERLQEVDRAEDLDVALVREVVDLLPVLDAVALVVETRVDVVAAGVESSSRG